MKAIIEVDVPDYQIGQEVNIHFKDTMMIKGVVQEPCEDTMSIEEIDFIQPKKIVGKLISVAVLDKIRAEIIELRSRQNVGVLECLDIINKYIGGEE